MANVARNMMTHQIKYSILTRENQLLLFVSSARVLKTEVRDSDSCDISAKCDKHLLRFINSV